MEGWRRLGKRRVLKAVLAGGELCVSGYGRGSRSFLQLHSRWNPNLLRPSGPQHHSESTSAKVPVISLLQRSPFSPFLHNYPGNCRVIDCIATSQKTLAPFNKQLEQTPHVVEI